MGSMVSELADAVVGVVQGVGLSSDTVARYAKCCAAVVEFCDRHAFDALSTSVIEMFVACQQERVRCGEIGRNRRNAVMKAAILPSRNRCGSSRSPRGLSVSSPPMPSITSRAPATRRRRKRLADT